MKNILNYILVITLLAVSCQRMERNELPDIIPDNIATGKVPITISTYIPGNTGTKAVIDPTEDIESLHLVLFDKNGMLVEVCEATTLDGSDHGEHHNGKNYTVTLTVTEEPRIVHFIANCPVDQIAYGHEASIIGNLYVQDNQKSYWARDSVPYIRATKTMTGDVITYSLDETIKPNFNHVPLLRNYAGITVVDKTDDTFIFEGYTIYNTIDRGTVAPYNNKNQKFQSFIKNRTGETVNCYSYFDMMQLPHPYEGHALASAQLITELPKNDDNSIKVFESGEPLYVYERKISVKTNEEDKWKESPVHVIIKGQFKPENSDTWNTYYYKVDFIYDVIDNNGTPDNAEDDYVSDVKYYNILRNFMYKFEINNVHDAGYTRLEDAINGAASNYLSGSATASKLTNIADNMGRLWVSYTDTTLVTGDAISLKYKYIPNYYDSSQDDYGKIKNSAVRIENLVGDVITNSDTTSTYISSGPWAGYRNLILQINDPTNTSKEQTIVLKTNNPNLTREIRFYLKKRYSLEVESTPRILKKIGAENEIKIILPPGVTEDMFPLELLIEVDNRTLSPNSSKNSLNLPVAVSESIIPEKNGENSFHYVATIASLADYRALPNEGSNKVLTTYWLSNLAQSDAKVYVDNKYFEIDWDDWTTVNYQFTDVAVITANIPKGEGKPVEITFTMDATDNNYAGRIVNLQLEGLKNSLGQSALEITPVNGTNVTMNGRKVTVTGLTTASAESAVGFSIENEEYMLAEAISGDRTDNVFGITGNGFTPSSLGVGAGLDVTYQFDLPEYYDNMVINVTLDGLEPADDALQELALRSTIKTYTYRPAAKGLQTLKLKTVNKDACTCTIELEADEYYYTKAVSNLEQSKESTLSFATKDNRTSYNNSKQVWLQNNIEFTNEKSSGTNVQDYANPVRIYKNQKIKVSLQDVSSKIKTIIFDCNNNTYATTLKNSIGNSATVSSDKVTVILDGTSTEFEINQLTNEVRLDSITVTY